MNNLNIEVVVQENFASYEAKIWVLDRTNKQMVGFLKNGYIDFKEYEPGVEVEPTMVMNRDIWKAIKNYMIDGNVREKNEVEAELGATKYHLEDMRKLIFKK